MAADSLPSIEQMRADLKAVPAAPAGDAMPSVEEMRAELRGASPAGAPQEPGMFDGVAKSAIDSLPMVGGIAGGILGTPADVVAGPMGNVVGAGIGGYLGTATKNLINSYYDPASAPKSNTEAITQPITGGAEQAAYQMAGEAASPYIAAGAKAVGKVVGPAAKWAGTKLASSLGGVAPDVIKEYLPFADRINSAPSVDALKTVSDEFVGKLADDVEAKRLTAQQAKEAHAGFQSDLKDSYKTAGYDARDAVNSAKQTLKDAHSSRIQQLAGDVYDAVGQLKSDVQKGSARALETLNKSGSRVDLAPVYSTIDSTISKMKDLGTDESHAVADKLQEYKSRLMSKNWAKIAAPDAKRLIQGLDQATTYSPMAGSFDQAKNAAFKGVRSVLDQAVKDAVPEYRAAMEPVAESADLLNRVSDFGDKQTAAGILSRINNPTQMERAQALGELGKKYGADFIGGADPARLPEQQLLNKTQAAQDALRPDRVASKVEETVGASRHKAALDAANAELESAQQKLAPFKSLAPNSAGQTNAQQKLLQLGKGKNIELEDMFQNLGKLTNTDFVQAMKDQHTLAAFQKGATNGSRNTLMGALAGFMFGGAGGAAAGGTAGRMVDQWGPAITKKALDGALRVAENPTVSAISQLELPEAIKRNMVVGLENYLTKGKAGSYQPAAAAAAAAAPTKGPDKWANDGVDKLKAHAEDDADEIDGMRGAMLSDPKGKQMLIQASDLKPGTKAMGTLLAKIKERYGNATA